MPVRRTAARPTSSTPAPATTPSTAAPASTWSPAHSKPNQKDNIRGGAGNDILIGGFGTDKVYGGPDDDYVIAEPSTVDLTRSSGDDGFGPVYSVTHTPLPAGVSPSSKTLVGGLGQRPHPRR